METTKKPTIQEAIAMAKQTGVVVSNIDLPEIMNYINEYEPTTKFKIEYNFRPEKTIIILK